MRRNTPWIHYARFDCVLDLRMDHRQGRLVGGLEMRKKVLAKCNNCGKTAERMKSNSGLACSKKGVYCGTMRVMEWLE